MTAGRKCLTVGILPCKDPIMGGCARTLSCEFWNPRGQNRRGAGGRGGHNCTMKASFVVCLPPYIYSLPINSPAERMSPVNCYTKITKNCVHFKCKFITGFINYLSIHFSFDKHALFEHIFMLLLKNRIFNHLKHTTVYVHRSLWL